MSPPDNDNKALVRRIFEDALNRDQTSVIEELIAPNYVNHDLPGPSPGPKGFAMMIGNFRNGFPDLHVTIEDLVAEGDRVVSRGFFTGTHRGEFQGIAPTGKLVKVKYLDMWRVANGLLVENWVQLDMLGLMQQLGVVSTDARDQR